MTRAQLAAARRIQALADKTSVRVSREVEAALKSLQSVRVIELEQAISLRDALAIHNMAAGLPLALRPAIRTLERLTRQVAVDTLQMIGGASIGMRFDNVNPFAVRAAHDHAAELVTNVTNETRLAIRSLVERSFAEGIAPRETAKLIQPLIGLTEKQGQAVITLRLRLEAQGLRAAKVAERAANYARRLRRDRAVTIARTETISASTRGSIATWKAAQGAGLLKQKPMKVWLVTPDDRLCKWCRRMDEQTVPLDALFISPLRRVVGPPLHVRCRCAVGLLPSSLGKPVPVRRVA